MDEFLAAGRAGEVLERFHLHGTRPLVGLAFIWDVNPATPLQAQDLAVIFSGRLAGILDVFYIGLDNSLHHTEW